MKKYPSAEELYQAWKEIYDNEDYFYIGLLLVLFGVFFLLPIYYSVQVYRQYNPRSLKVKYRLFVGQMAYFQNLNPLDRLLFEKRVQLFINNKKFISRGKGFHLSDEMIAKIAASAVEISFGFPKMGFEHFSRILVYPDDYYSNITRKFHAGEVNARGFIVLSWRSFQKGYDNNDDGINLGIHEMAHALKLENRIKNGDYHFLKAELMGDLEEEFVQYQSIRESKKENLLRSYALSNIHEFFAVLCENFFERPQLLEEENRSLYNLMSQLLMQNPLANIGRASSQFETVISPKLPGPVERY